MGGGKSRDSWWFAQQFRSPVGVDRGHFGNAPFGQAAKTDMFVEIDANTEGVDHRRFAADVVGYFGDGNQRCTGV